MAGDTQETSIIIKAVDNVSGVLGNIGRSIVNFAGVAIKATGAFLADSVNVAGDFEATLNKFSSVTGDALGSSGKSIQDFSALFLKMGADTQFSAQQAGDAAVELAKGGLSPAQIAAGGLEGALALAAAGELELAEAANITAKQLGVWAEQGVTATDVANLFAQAANASTVDVDELALGMANVGASGKAIGASFKEVTQTMALISSGFSSASDAGTSLKVMFTRLVPSTADAKGAFAEYGLSVFDSQKALAFLSSQGIKPASDSLRDINKALVDYTEKTKMSKKEAQDFFLKFEQNKFFDAQGNFLGMANAAKVMQESLKGLSNQEKIDVMRKIFGDDGARAAMGLIEAGAEGFEKMGLAMDGAGSALDQAAERNKGFAFAMESMKGSLETVQIILGTFFLPILTNVVQQGIIPAINAFGEFAQKIANSADPVGEFKSQMDLLIPGFGAFATGVVNGVQTAITWITANWPQIQATIGASLAAVGGFVDTYVAPAMNSAITLFSNLVAWVAANWPQIEGTMETVAIQVGSFVVTYIQPAINTASTLFSTLVSWVITNWPQIQTVIGAVFTAVSAFVTGYVVPAMGVILSTLGGVVSWVATNWPQISSIFSTVFTLAMGYIDTIVKPALALAVAALSGLVSWVVTNWPQFSATIGSVLSAASGFFTTYIQPAIATAMGLFSQLVSWVNTNWPAISATIGSVLQQVGGFVNTYIMPNMTFAIDLFQQVVDWVNENWPLIQKTIKVVMDALQPIIGPILSMMSSTFTTQTGGMLEIVKVVFGGIFLAITGTLNIVRDTVKSILGVILGLFKAGMQALTGDTGAALETLRGLFVGKFTAIKDFIAGLPAVMLTLGKGIVEGLMSSLTAGAERIRNYLISMVMGPIDDIKNLLGIHSPSKFMEWIGNMMTKGFTNGVSNMRGVGAFIASSLRDGAKAGLEAAVALTERYAQTMAEAVTSVTSGGDVGSALASGVEQALAGGPHLTESDNLRGDSGGEVSDGEAAGAVQQIILSVDGETLARAVMNRGTPAARVNRMRSYAHG